MGTQFEVPSVKEKSGGDMMIAISQKYAPLAIGGLLAAMVFLLSIPQASAALPPQSVADAIVQHSPGTGLLLAGRGHFSGQLRLGFGGHRYGGFRLGGRRGYRHGYRYWGFWAPLVFLPLGRSDYGHSYRRWVFISALSWVVLRRLDYYQRDGHDLAFVRAAQAPIGQTIHWQRGDIAGSVTALRDGDSSVGRYCREFRQVIVIDGRRHSQRNAACRGSDGVWQFVEG